MIFGISPDLGIDTGIDYEKLWEDAKKAAKSLPGAIYKEAVKTAEEKLVSAVKPTVQAQAEQKASRVVSKGNIALTAAIGATAGILIAGGSWQRKALGGTVGLVLGGLAGLKIGLISDV